MSKLKILIVFTLLLPSQGCMMMHRMHHDSQAHESNHKDKREESGEHKNHEASKGEDREARELKTEKEKRSKMWILGGVGMAVMMILMLAL